MKADSLILVTGGTGFVGAYLIRLLVQQGCRVRALRRAESPMDLVRDIAGRVEWVEADVTDVVALEDAFEGVTHVCHCAAMVSFHPRDLRRMMQINVEGTANMVNLALDHGVQKFVHVSSIAAIGRSEERTHLDEKSPWVHTKSTTNYALSKYLGEQEVWRGHAEGLPVGIVNPAIILGSGFWDVGSARFFQQVQAGLKFWPIGRSGFVDVRDVAQFMWLLLDGPVNGERFVLNAQNITYREFFQQVAATLGARPPAIKVTPLLAEIAWRVEWLKEKVLGATPIVTKESARSSLNQFYYDAEKSLTMPGFAYRPLDQTIRETGAQFKEALQDNMKARVLPFG